MPAGQLDLGRGLRGGVCGPEARGRETGRQGPDGSPVPAGPIGPGRPISSSAEEGEGARVSLTHTAAAEELPAGAAVVVTGDERNARNVGPRGTTPSIAGEGRNKAQTPRIDADEGQYQDTAPWPTSALPATPPQALARAPPPRRPASQCVAGDGVGGGARRALGRTRKVRGRRGGKDGRSDSPNSGAATSASRSPNWRARRGRPATTAAASARSSSTAQSVQQARPGEATTRGGAGRGDAGRGRSGEQGKGGQGGRAAPARESGKDGPAPTTSTDAAAVTLKVAINVPISRKVVIQSEDYAYVHVG